jgi:glycine/D-amino acid oxidase-like deaminating enzyme
MDTVSVWHAGAPATTFSALPGDAETDVVIVGGGITGITLAALLSDAGRRVIVLEAQRVGDGTTGHSTGNLYGVVGQLRELERAWDADTARRVVQSRLDAVDFIETMSRRLPAECHFRRVPHLIYAVDGQARDGVHAVFESVRLLGLACSFEVST